MPQEMNLPEELDALGRMLAATKPSRPALNRDDLIYEAGRAAATRTARRKMWLWQGACALALLACGELTTFPREKIGERTLVKATASAPIPAPPQAVQSETFATTNDTPAAPMQANTLLQLRNQVLRYGVQALPDDGGGAAGVPALTPADGLDALPAWQRRAALSTGA
jgi:hypothetical protein